MKKLLLILLISLLFISCNGTPQNTPGGNPSSESGTGNSENADTTPDTTPETNPVNNDDQEDALAEAERKEIFDDFLIKYIFESYKILSESYPDNDLPHVVGLDSEATSVTDKVVSFPGIDLEVKVDLTYEKNSDNNFTKVKTIKIKELSINDPEITDIVLNTSKSNYNYEEGSGNILYIDSITIKGQTFKDISTGLIDDVNNYFSSMLQYIGNDTVLKNKLNTYTEPVSGYEVNYADATISATGTLDILKTVDNEFTLTGTLDFVIESGSFKLDFDKTPIINLGYGIGFNPASMSDEGKLNMLKTIKFNDIEYSKLLLVIINSMD